MKYIASYSHYHHITHCCLMIIGHESGFRPTARENFWTPSSPSICLWKVCQTSHLLLPDREYHTFEEVSLGLSVHLSGSTLLIPDLDLDPQWNSFRFVLFSISTCYVATLQCSENPYFAALLPVTYLANCQTGDFPSKISSGPVVMHLTKYINGFESLDMGSRQMRLELFSGWPFFLQKVRDMFKYSDPSLPAGIKWPIFQTICKQSEANPMKLFISVREPLFAQCAQ